MVCDSPTAPYHNRRPAGITAAFENADNEKMNEIRDRCNAVVSDPVTAENLKAWYRQV